MQSVSILRETEIERTPRVKQLEGLFDIAPSKRSSQTWEVNLPLSEKNWNIGLIVGPSGSGKSTIAKELFPEKIIESFEWNNRSIVDNFPKEQGIKEITAMLSSVGFSSPPNWLKPFNVLSNGEQFRVTLARAIAENNDLFVVDEFTSVIDRQVAQIGSAAVAKAIRQRSKKFIALSCHYDIIEWLQPDWIYQPHTNIFEWRHLRRRPEINITVQQVHRKAWELFKKYHYLDTNISQSAQCFVGLIDNSPAVFTAVLPFPHPKRSGWKEHRTVCLPDFQGIGIGNAFSETIAAHFKEIKRKPYFSTTSNPAMIYHRAKSKKWKMVRKPSKMSVHSSLGSGMKASSNRLTAGFEYIG